MHEVVTVRGWVRGRVQGVGFRWHVRQHAQDYQVTGYACNLNDGRVEVLLQGCASAVQMVQTTVEQGPGRSRVDRVEWHDEEQPDRSSLLIPDNATDGGYDHFTIG